MAMIEFGILFVGLGLARLVFFLLGVPDPCPHWYSLTPSTAAFGVGWFTQMAFNAWRNSWRYGSPNAPH